MRSISHHSIPLVITSVEGGHTDMHVVDKINLWCGRHAPGLEIKLYMAYNIIRDLKTTTIMLFGVFYIVFLVAVPIMHHEIIP